MSMMTTTCKSINFKTQNEIVNALQNLFMNLWVHNLEASILGCEFSVETIKSSNNLEMVLVRLFGKKVIFLKYFFHGNFYLPSSILC